MTKKNTNKVILAYVPVIHEGYKRFFEKHKDAKKLFILGKSVTDSYKNLTKDIRAIDPGLIQKALSAWNVFHEVIVIEAADLEIFLKENKTVIMPDEDVMRDLWQKYGSKNKAVFDSIFLRWDKHKSSEGQSIEVDQKISSKSKDIKIISLLMSEAKKSSDWWRQVSAAIVKDGKIVAVSYNHHVPNEFMPYVNGDPRADFSKGINIELSTSIHAEAALIAESAKKGLKLDGASMYVTTFPCPPCAKLIAYSGIKEVYYSGGYGVLDGESVLKSRGVKIIFVETKKK